MPITGGPPLLLAGKGSRGRQVLELIELSTGKTRTFREGMYPSWSPSGHILFASTAQGDLWSLPFWLESRGAAANAVPVLSRAGDFSVAADNTLVWVDQISDSLRRLAWQDRSGNQVALTIAPQFGISD